MAACVSTGPELPAGTYRCSATQETLEVSGHRIRFHLKLDIDQGSSWHDSTTGYFLDVGSKKILPNQMTSAEAFDGAGRFEWRWNGTTIERRDRRQSSAAVLFVRD